ncbi:hypothetical protein ONZ45_g1560 [Pleurotus djamor]|nr:hypothetical protein ONZ45_g1560 [Pleurotus djamor]
MASKEKSKKSRTKPPKSRPASTTTISQPVVNDASHVTELSAFSPKGDLFAFLTLAVEKHRLRIYDTTTSQSVAEHTLDTARVTALAWSEYSDLNDAGTDETPSPNKKRRKKKHSVTGQPENSSSGGIHVVVLGLSDGSLVVFSPSHARVIQTLSSPTSSASILSIAAAENKDGTRLFWTCSSDGTTRLWNAHTTALIGNWKNDERIPYTSAAIRQTDKDQLELLVAHHRIQLLSLKTITSAETQKPLSISTFTGHASPIKQLQWDVSQQPPTRFLSLAEADRLVYLWELPQSESSSSEGRIAASIALDSDARVFDLTASPSPTLLTVSASGKTSIYPIPAELVPPASSSKAHANVPSLLPKSNIFSPSKQQANVRVVNAGFVHGQEGAIRIVRMVGGVRPFFDLIKYTDESGGFVESVTLKEITSSVISDISKASNIKRYAEATATVGSGVEVGQDQDADDVLMQTVDGDLDVDIAELSLGQRLAAISGKNPPTPDNEEEDSETGGAKSRNATRDQPDNLVPANSLTRTLIQALHSSDAKLIETCLSHSDPVLINNTVRRLPPQLVVSLIDACVERLGRGGRGANMKGRGGGASSQRSASLIIWIRSVLTIHSGHLMTIPNLVARLSSLHATLSRRLAVQESLLSLSGRLDMVLTQIEMRSSTAPTPLGVPREKQKSTSKAAVARRYVEGESEDEDAQMDVEVEVDSEDEEGSVEDVELGGDSDDDEDEDEAEMTDEDEEDEEEDEEGPTLNGFIDDEAEEDEDEEDESD